MADKLLKSITFPDLTDKYIIGDTSLSVAGAGADAKATGDALETKANVDGSYESMTVGNAEQLVSNVRVNDKTPYIFRTSGGSVDIGDREYVNGIVGGTVAWNQQITNGNFESTSYWGVPTGFSVANNIATLTPPTSGDIYSDQNISLVAGHKYLYSVDAKADNNTASKEVLRLFYGSASDRLARTVSDSNWHNIAGCFACAGTALNKFRLPNYAGETSTHWKNAQVFDLTQMFGSTIADYIYSLETATAGAGVAWFKKLFNKPYYAYNVGELKSVSGLASHDMTGFNQCTENWRQGDWNSTTTASRVSIVNTDRPHLIGGVSYCLNCDNSGYMLSAAFLEEIDSTSYFSTLAFAQSRVFTAPKDCYMAIVVAKSDNVSNITPTEITNNCKITLNLAWDNSRNGEYEPYELHSYPLDSDLTLRGIPKLDANNNLYYDGDIYEADGTVTRKYGIVDLGTLTWTYNSTNEAFFTWSVTDIIKTANTVLPSNIICPKYITLGSNYVYSATGTDKSTALLNGGAVIVKDMAYTDATAFKTAMSGVYLVYELATPTTETADPYQQTQIVNDFGTEEYVIDSNTFAVPVGSDTDYPVNLVAKLEMAPNSPDGSGDYIVRQTNGVNEYVPLVIEDALPTIPSTAGTYTLTVTVADGSDPVLSWEA